MVSPQSPPSRSPLGSPLASEGDGVGGEEEGEGDEEDEEDEPEPEERGVPPPTAHEACCVAADWTQSLLPRPPQRVQPSSGQSICDSWPLSACWFGGRVDVAG